MHQDAPRHGQQLRTDSRIVSQGQPRPIHTRLVRMAEFALRRADNQAGRVGQGRTAEQPVAARIPYSGLQYFVHGIGGFYGYNATKYNFVHETGCFRGQNIISEQKSPDYQMTTLSSSGLYIGSPSLMPNASKKVSRLRTLTLTRFSPSECTSRRVRRCFSWSVMFCAHTVA